MDMSAEVINKFPAWLVRSIYSFSMHNHCAIENVSIHYPSYAVADDAQIAITGGQKDIKPIHNRYNDYMSIQKFAKELLRGNIRYRCDKAVMDNWET